MEHQDAAGAGAAPQTQDRRRYGGHSSVARDGSAGHGAGPAPTGAGPGHAWPLTSSLPLMAAPTAPGCARLFTKAVLFAWGLSALDETAELVVSEICTNAVRAAREPGALAQLGVPAVHLRLLSDGRRLVIEVWDGNPRAPVATHASEDDESGRGLMLVEAVCQRWGTATVPDWPGKLVWAELLRTF